MNGFDPGFEIYPQFNPLGFNYGPDCFGPKVENRKLDAIRASLKDPLCQGPDIVYSIAMDVGKIKHRQLLQDMHLLFGAVIYAAGSLGQEPVRAQGHIHKKSDYAGGWSTPEVYEIWTGKAVIYMQETAQDDPGRCFAVYATPGEVVVVPPGWAHATISADPNHPLTFGAWCDRDYAFEYDLVRAHQGLAWYPLLYHGRLTWERNRHYLKHRLVEKSPDAYSCLNLQTGIPIYQQFENSAENFWFVSKPKEKSASWKQFVP